MKIAVLSGKGGTGKTFVSVNLASAAKEAFYADCDIEEPNGHLFFKPENIKKEDISVKIPHIDQEECDGCRECCSFCAYNALAFVGGKVLLFDNLCHSCGGCKILCHNQAISEKDKRIGIVETGKSENVTVVTGHLNIGEASGIPIIKNIISKLPKETFSVIDCPPGSACTVMESIQKADYCLLVAEPTLFGLHNMEMVFDLIKIFKKPYGVVINKYLFKNNPVKDFCLKNNIKILDEIAYDIKLGKFNSDGNIVVRNDSVYASRFEKLLNEIKGRVQ